VAVHEKPAPAQGSQVVWAAAESGKGIGEVVQVPPAQRIEALPGVGPPLQVASMPMIPALSVLASVAKLMVTGPLAVPLQGPAPVSSSPVAQAALLPAVAKPPTQARSKPASNSPDACQVKAPPPQGSQRVWAVASLGRGLGVLVQRRPLQLI